MPKVSLITLWLTRYVVNSLATLLRASAAILSESRFSESGQSYANDSVHLVGLTGWSATGDVVSRQALVNGLVLLALSHWMQEYPREY